VVTHDLIEKIKNGMYDETLKDIYVDEKKIAYERERYIKAIESYTEHFGEGEVFVFSAPGRSEIGGNHTDHQCGEVLAASINNDVIAIVQNLEEPCVRVISAGYEMITIYLDDLCRREDEEATTTALIRGVLAKTKEYGYQIGGFQAVVTSDVLIGAGLSSSAAFETLMGTILSELFNDGKISPIEIAMIGQFAENVYFGKPCGLMDQMACSVGSLAHIDFQNPVAPLVEQIEFDLDGYGYSLCITDTKGSHADLTSDYAAIPEEMKRAAACLGKEVLGQVTRKEVLTNLPRIREQAGDRAALRAIHYVCENERVQKEVAALREKRFGEFLRLVKESGDSSYKYLQNVYVCHDVEHQNVSIALAVSDMILGTQGANRVHGGGFAGTIQAFVPNDIVTLYKTEMEKVFGDGACDVLKIRKYGGIQVM
jgi:galactokinase